MVISLKIDLKLVAVTCIFLGLFMGFYVDRTLISKPKIETLTSQVDTQLVTIEGLEQDLSQSKGNSRHSIHYTGNNWRTTFL